MELNLTIKKNEPFTHIDNASVSLVIDDEGVWISCDKLSEQGEEIDTYFIKELTVKEIISLKHFADACIAVRLINSSLIIKEQLGQSLDSLNTDGIV